MARLDPSFEAASQQAARAVLETPTDQPSRSPVVSEPFIVLLACRDEKQQVELRERFWAEGLECKALVSYGCSGGSGVRFCERRTRVEPY